MNASQLVLVKPSLVVPLCGANTAILLLIMFGLCRTICYQYIRTFPQIFHWMKSRLYKVFRFSDVCLFLGRAPYPFFSFNFMFIILVLLLIIDYFFFFQFHVYFISIFFFFSDCAFHGERAAISFLFRSDIQALAPFSSEDNFSDIFFSF